jgi:hypothetical protein
MDGIRRNLADLVVRRHGRGADRHAGAGALGRAVSFAALRAQPFEAMLLLIVVVATGRWSLRTPN